MSPASSPTPALSPKPLLPSERPLRRSLPRILAWCAGAALAVTLLLALLGVLVARRVQPLVHARLVQTLEQRFHSPVLLDDVALHYSGQLQVDGRGLRVQSVLTGIPGDPQHPMLQVGEFHFQTGLLSALSHDPRMHHVRIRGVQLDLPPQAGQPGHTPEPKNTIDLDSAEIDDAHIRFLTDAADRAPLVFDLPHLSFRGVSRIRPIRFHAVVDNGPPLGITETDGTIGPWNFDDPRQSPIEGTIVMRDKDVSSVRGLRGRVSVTGRYQGTVGSMHAEGTSDDPSFALDVSSHPVHFRTSFALTMQPSASTITLERVDGAFGRTSFLCRGTAIKDRAAQSFRLDLQLQTTGARVEDALTLGTRTAPPVLRGVLTVKGRLGMRAGPESVSRKLSLDHASFTVGDGTFSNASVQQTFNGLAERAEGDPKDATPDRAAPASAAMRGTVMLRNAVLRFPAVEVATPGAQAALHGTYSLSGTGYTFDGTVHTEAELSHMTTGVKSVLARPFNRLFHHGKRPGEGGATLPLHIQGVGNVPHLDTRLMGMTMKAPGTH